MTVYMTQTEYAKHRGISQPRVSKMIRDGKLKGCLKAISGKKRIDRDLADAALEERLDRVYNKPKTPEPTKSEKAKVIAESGIDERQELAESQRQEALYKAALKKLEYETKKRDLLPADEVKKMLADLILSIRGDVLAIEGDLAPLLKEFISNPENFGIIKGRIGSRLRDALERMADYVIK